MPRVSPWKRTWRLATELLELCADVDVILELEIGIVGGVEDAMDNEDVDRAKLYTSPEDMVRVAEVLGTSDGPLSAGGRLRQRPRGLQAGRGQARPRDPSRRAEGGDGEVREPARHYLVFHGGSGSSLDEIRETLGYGVVKMNIDTDCQYAYTRPIVDHMMTNYGGVLKVDGEVGDKKAYDPRSYMKKAETGMAPRVVEACDSCCRRAGRSAEVDDRHQTWASSERFVPTRFIQPFVRFTRIEASSGIVLLAATVVALIWANSRFSDTYNQSSDQPHCRARGFHLEEDVQG